MRFLANENFPLDAIDALKREGHDVSWILARSPGIKDPAVLSLAVAERRILLTFDKDFGELAFRAGLPGECGIILFRFSARSSASLASLVVAALNSRDSWAGHFAVVETHRIRIRPLPPAPPA